MKKLFLNILFVVLISISANAQDNQNWKWINQYPQGNALYWVKMWDANTWYAVGNNGTFMKTTNAGQNWFINHKSTALLHNGEGATLYSAYFFNLNTGFVVGANNYSSYSGDCTGGGVYKTTNGGLTFDSVPGFRYDKPIYYYKIIFISNNIGYIAGNYWENGVYYPMIYRTNDGGQTWNSIGQNITTQQVKARGIYAWDSLNVIVCANFGEVYKSTDAGLTWNVYITGNSVDLTQIKFIDANTGFTCGGSSALRMTSNGGVNWTALANVPNSNNYDMNIINSNGTSIYLTGNNYYLFRTTNLGTSWDTIKMYQTNPATANEMYSSDISITGDTIISVGYFGNINKTIGLNNYTNISKNIRGGIIYDLWVQGTGNSNIIAVGNYTSSAISVRDQITRSTDGGNTWTVSTYSGIMKPTFNSIQMLDNNTGWIVGTSSSVYKTTNGGISWDSIGVTGMLSGVSLNKVFFVNQNTGWVFAGSFPTADSSTNFKTTDGGATWTKSMVQNSKHYITGAYFVDENTGWVTDNKTGRPYKTTDGGNSWSQQTLVDNPASIYFYDIQMIDANTGYLCGGSRRVYKTTNGGSLWDTTNIPYMNTTGTITGISFINASTGVAVAYNGMTFLTTNGGTNWTFENAGCGIFHSVWMAPNGKMFAVADMGEIMKNESIMTIIETKTDETPISYTLYQNYPNPFNPTTKIKFQIMDYKFTTLKVYNILGKEVASLVNSNLKPGTYEVSFDGSMLSSGVYFYKLEAGNYISTKKMILIK